jgi:hypothetical protein
MSKRIPVSAAVAGLALSGALCACGSNSPHAASAGVGAGSTAPSSTTAPAKPSSPAKSSPSSSASSSPGHGVSPGPISGGGPIIFAVRLGNSFDPSTLRISPGMHFVLTVDSTVKATGPALPACSGTTSTIDNGMLTVSCAGGSYTYTAQRAGTAELMATVRPNCAQGTMCPQWIAEATLKITIL